MESQVYSVWIPETHKANQNITGESDEEERSQASGGSKELGVKDFKRTESVAGVNWGCCALTKKNYNINIEMYTCEVCDKIDTKKGSMTSHMMKHTGLPFSCDICGEKFKLCDFLTRHKHSKHSEKLHLLCVQKNLPAGHIS